MAAMMSQSLNMVLQVGILALLGVAYVSFRRNNFARHAQLMAFAWAMNIASFLLIMIPSLAANMDTFTIPPIIFFDVASIIHIPIGIAALGLSTFLVVRWTLNSGGMGGCYGKGLMRATMVTWAASVILGVSIYFTMPS